MGVLTENSEISIDDRVGSSDQFEPIINSRSCRVVDLFRPKRYAFLPKSALLFL
jgi:hypothetical protein